MKKYKRSLIFILFLTIALCVCAVALVACKNVPDNPPPVDPEPHQHNYKLKSETPASCTEEGSKLYVCSCGESYTETVAALEHDLHWKSVEGGATHWQKCSRCDYRTEEQSHNFETVSVEKESTCTEKGREVVKCVCGASKTQDIEEKAHIFTVTNFDDAHHWTECKVCHSEQPDSRASHEFDIPVSSTPSTCKQQGSEVTRCDCGATHTEILPFAKHSYTVKYNDDEHWQECSVCQTVQEGSRVSHSYVVDDELSFEPTCTKDGLTVKHCDCGKTITEEPVALGHSYDKSDFVNRNSAGHFYKCIRCEQTEFELHTLEDVDCPEGQNKAPTCGKQGHQDKHCTLCDYSFHETVPATGEHTPSEGYESNGTHHWRICTVCEEKLNEEQHAEWTEKVVSEASCTQNGEIVEQCEICGYEHSRRTVNKTDHKFEYDESTRNDSTCTEAGSVEKFCTVCGMRETEAIRAKGHDVSKEWYSDATGHWKKCTRCGADINKGNHDPREGDRQTSTCTEKGYVEYTCNACQFVWKEELSLAAHNFEDDPDSYVESTCTVAGYHYKKCKDCNTRERVEDPLEPHQPVEFKAQERTETQDGWIHHWQCTVCGKYFTSRDCHEEIPEEDVFDRNPEVVEVESLAELREIARELYATQQSICYYKVTAKVEMVEADEHMAVLSDGDVTIWLYFNDDVNLYTITEGDTLTVKGFLKMDSLDDIALYESVILSVQSNSDIYSLYVTITGDYTHSKLYAVSESGEDFSLVNYRDNCQLDYYNSLLYGEELTFSYSCYVGIVVRSLVINGESQTMTNGELTVKVTGDMYCEFDLSSYNLLTATVNNFALPWNAPAQKVNGYLSYQIENNQANNSHLVKNSHLQITVINAYITGVTIEFENYNLAEVAKNTINVGIDSAHKQKTTYSLEKTQAKLTFDETQKLGFFEYVADVSQARIKSITVYYNTYNS